MSKSPYESPLHKEEGRALPWPEASPNPIPLQEQADSSLPSPVSFQTSLQKTNSSGREGALTKNLGYPLRFLLRNLDDSIPPSEKPVRKVDATKTEAPLPASPLRSPNRDAEYTTLSVDSPKSSGRERPFFATRLNSLVEGTGSSIGYTERSPEKLTENHVTVSASEFSGGSGREKVMRVESWIVPRAAMWRTEVGLRVSEVVLCLVSFSVMAANRTSGWDGDYFDRYQEYRIWKRHIISGPFGYSFDFSMDQVLTYLLISSSSSAASVNDDWVSMFGSDRFTDMMIASVATSFFAFLAFSITSIVSAHKLFSCDS